MTSQYLSKEGLEKLREEYELRTNTTRGDIAARIKEAKDQGDLSENQEYMDAKEAQSMNEGRIEELKSMLDNAIVIESSSARGGTVTVGSVIRVAANGDSRDFVIVGAAEADPSNGRISNESPLGAAFLGRKKGDKVSVATPKGPVDYKILEVK
ncbi:MAG TPA: transcription elongation factor GreA [Candidatus Paceibacterota bacterium]|nr:transcription elongation factor GreA [Candidatus Paceibacterota bacterium]